MARRTAHSESNSQPSQTRMGDRDNYPDQEQDDGVMGDLEYTLP